MVTVKGVPSKKGGAPGTQSSSSGKVNTSNFGTDIGEIKTPQPKAMVTIKGIPKGTPKTSGSGVEKSTTDLINQAESKI